VCRCVSQWLAQSQWKQLKLRVHRATSAGLIAPNVSRWILDHLRPSTNGNACRPVMSLLVQGMSIFVSLFSFHIFQPKTLFVVWIFLDLCRLLLFTMVVTFYVYKQMQIVLTRSLQGQFFSWVPSAGTPC